MSWQFDHLAFNTPDGSDLQDAFARLLGLAPGKRPPFPFPGRWLYQQDQALVHVLEGQAQEALSHIAFRSTEAAEHVLQRVRDSGFAFQVARVPEEKVLQIFVQLPAGVVLELDVPDAELDLTHDYSRAGGAPIALEGEH
ncbi:MAG: hypothetical protein AAGC84_01625 [Pseudomonas sp.]